MTTATVIAKPKSRVHLVNLPTTNLVNTTKIEEQILRDKRVGYADYTVKVHYRLIPGV